MTLVKQIRKSKDRQERQTLEGVWSEGLKETSEETGVRGGEKRRKVRNR